MRRFALLAVALGFALTACSSDGRDTSRPLIIYEAQIESAVNVFTIDPESGESSQLTFGTLFDGNPAWAPDRSRIVFVSRRDGNQDMFTMDASGGDVHRLTTTPGSEWSPRFSPDGSQIAYTLQGSQWSLWLMDADGSNARQLAGGYDFAEFPAWRPDGKEIIFSARSAGERQADIFSVDVATSSVTTRIATEGSDVCPHFSHDGTRITYARSAGGSDLDIYVRPATSADVSGASDTRLTDVPERDDYANWSPDDKTIVFTSQRDGNVELYLMLADGSEQRRLTTTPAARENVPDW